MSNDASAAEAQVHDLVHVGDRFRDRDGHRVLAVSEVVPDDPQQREIRGTVTMTGESGRESDFPYSTSMDIFNKIWREGRMR